MTQWGKMGGQTKNIECSKHKIYYRCKIYYRKTVCPLFLTFMHPHWLFYGLVKFEPPQRNGEAHSELIS